MKCLQTQYFLIFLAAFVWAEWLFAVATDFIISLPGDSRNHQIIAAIKLNPNTFTINTAILIPAIVYSIDYTFSSILCLLGLRNRNLLALVTTVIDDRDIAIPAIIGLKSPPVNGNKTPAAMGIPNVL